MKKTIINLKKLSAIITILLIAGFATNLSTTMASNGNQLSQSQQFGAENSSDNSTLTSNPILDSNQGANDSSFGVNAKQYNRTDVTPKNETEQVRAQEQTMFQYRNMTMTMNCTLNCTVTFCADEEVTPKILGINVDPNQTLTLAMNLTKSPLNGAFVNERCLNFYLGIEPHATLRLQAQIRLYINQTELSGELNREINASRLTWMYWNQTRAQWEAVQSYMDQNGYLVCNTDHFSTWTVAETVESAPETTPLIQNSAIQIEYIGIGVLAVVVIIALGFVAYKKRK